MRNILFIAWSDLRYQLRQGSTLLWVVVMPPIFFYFIGTVTGGFSSGVSGGQATPLVVEAPAAGYLRAQIDLRLRDNDFEPKWVDRVDAANPPARVLRLTPKLSEAVSADEQVTAEYDTRANALSREFEIIRIQRSLYTVVADIVVADANSNVGLNATELESLNAEPRVWQLAVSPAGERLEIPSGFEQAVPGILVMFTLLVLLTSGGTLLVTERKQGLLRRLASAPISRTEVVAGKWFGRMVLAIVQVSVALAFGTFIFNMNWGPDIGMVMLVLFAWGGFCATAGLWLGSVASTEAQASGLGVLAANALAALGGCWWPIEVTPPWMQGLQNLMPTGWTMDALHKLVSFQAGAASAVSEVMILVVASLIVAVMAVRRFRYE